MVILEIAREQGIPSGMIVTVTTLIVVVLGLFIFAIKTKDCKNGEKSRYVSASRPKKQI